MSNALEPCNATHSAQSRHFLVALLGLLALTAAMRLPGITRPLLGNFATKNVVYGMIARNWAQRDASLLYPTLDVLRGGHRSLVMVEFPVSAFLTAGLWQTLGGSLDVWGRATAVGFSVASVALMFLLVRRWHGQAAAVAAALAMALSPVGIIYGQSFMLEASLVFFTLAAFYSLDRWLDAGGWLWLAAAGTCLALLLLTKIYMLVVLLPLGAMFLRSQRGRKKGTGLICRDGPKGAPHKLDLSPFSPPPAMLLVTLVLSLLPAACWYVHAAQTASPGEPLAERVYFSVRRSAGDHLPPHPLLFRPDFYGRLLVDLTGVVLTPVGFVLLLAGLTDRRWLRHAPWLAAMAVLILALPRKFHEMNYYWMAVLPPLCILAGIGWDAIRRRLCPGRMVTGILVLAAVGLSLRYSIRPAFVTPDEDRGVPAAAREVRGLVAEGHPIVTRHGTSIDLLYYCRRPGWTLEPGEPKAEKKLREYYRQGARYLVVVGGDVPELEPSYRSGEDFRIYRLPARQVPCGPPTRRPGYGR